MHPRWAAAVIVISFLASAAAAFLMGLSGVLGVQTGIEQIQLLAVYTKIDAVTYTLGFIYLYRRYHKGYRSAQEQRDLSRRKDWEEKK